MMQQPGPDPSLSIVVVNWNTRELLCSCLGSIQGSADPADLKVIVVDNGSTDGSSSMVGSDFQWVRLIQNGENQGFARANNQALPLCRGRYIMLLNSDTEVLPGTLDHMIEFMDRHPEVAILGPTLIDPEGALQVQTAGDLPTLRSVFIHYLFLSRLVPRRFRGFYLIPSQIRNEPVPVEWVSAACLVARREVFEQLGGFDEDYFFYAEVFEFCERAKDAGFRAMHLPSAKVVHVGGGSTQELPVQEAARWMAALHRHFAKSHSRLETIAFDLIHFTGLSIRAILHFLLALLGGGQARRRKAKMLAYESVRALQLALELVAEALRGRV